MEGWLKKSPPEKRLWRGKWRRRWFVLRQSGQIPGQYILEYFTDQACRKLKGHIDLDQCEQVDAGVAIDDASRKCSYVHVFDIRTPKRLYYLVADSEADMNKWVDCICAVCGLKMHEEEELQQGIQAASATTPAGTVAVQPESWTPQLGNNATLIPVDITTSLMSAQPTPSERASSNYYWQGSGSTGTLSLPHPTTPTSPSGPYIPISECHTGTNGFLLPLEESGLLRSESNAVVAVASEDDDEEDDDDDEEPFPDCVPPPPPKTMSSEKRINNNNSEERQSGDFYDYPRQIHPRSLDEDFYSVPADVHQQQEDDVDEKFPPSIMLQSHTLTTVPPPPPPPPPPKVNWETYPGGDSEAVHETRRGAFNGHQDTYDHPVPSNTSVKTQLTCLSLSDDVSIEKTIAPAEAQSLEASNGTMPLKPPPPPRPPKPKPQHLIVSLQHTKLSPSSSSSLSSQPVPVPGVRNVYDNIEDCEAMLYDIPPSAQGIFLSKNLPANAFAYLKDDSTAEGGQSTVNVSLDEMYDFPRPLHEDQLGATPPAPSGDSLTWHRRHNYSNAPTTSMAQQPDEDVVSVDDEYLSMENQKQQKVGVGTRRRSSSGGMVEVYTDMSGEARSPNNGSSLYTNVPSPMPNYDNVFVLENPPAVDRKLKPQRRASEASVVVNSSQGPTSGSPALNTWSPNSETNAKRLLAHPPPIVNRTLKPKRTSVDSGEGGVNATNVTTITLSPPPLGHHPHQHHRHHHNRQQTHKKRSFRRPKEIPSPNIAACHRRLLAAAAGINSSSIGTHLSNGSSTMTSLHPPSLNRQATAARSDRSSSDDDQSSTCSSRRNSSNDDHAPSKSHIKSPSPSLFTYGGGSIRRHEPEIQYLDLDLESDAANSATAANMLTSTTINTGALSSSSSSSSAAPAATTLVAHSPKSPERFATNTVYKTVDFVRTKAFNEMRQNVEETYRNSQY